MADVKISALPAVVTAAGTDIHPVVQGGVTMRETLAQALTWIQTQVAPIPAGGTGLASYTIGDLIYASGATTLAKLADVATGNALLSGGIGVAPSWGKVGLTTHVSGILPLANGGSGVDLSATGGANQIVRQNSAGGVFTVSVLAAADIPNLDASKIATGALALARGGTHADLSATGGAGQYLKQAGAGADVTVGTIPATDLTYSGLTTGQLLRATGATSVAFGALDLTNGNAVTNALGAANGGTGKASYTIGDILYASAATTLTRLAGVATGNALISGGVATDISWGKIGLTTHVSGILPSANGGTGVNNAGTITNASNTIITGGGTLALGGFTATIPATLTVAGLAIANVFTAAQAIQRDAIAAASTDGMILTNTTAAAVGVQQWSPRVHWTAQGWKTTATAASQTVEWIAELVPVQAAATPAAQLRFSSQLNGGGYVNQLSFVDATSSNCYVQLGTSANTGVGLGGGNQAVLGLFAGNAVELMRAQTGALKTLSGIVFQWANSTSSYATVDTGLARNAAGVVEINNATAGQWGALKCGVRDANLSTVINTLTMGHQISAGTVAAGHGIGILLNLATDNAGTPNNDQNAARLTVEWATATNTSQKARGKLTAFDTSERECIRWEASGSAPMIGVLGAAAVVRQTGGENLTNNVTSGGVDGTIANYTDLTIYANDAAAIRNDIYQLARALKQDHDALRLYGFLT